MDLGDPDLEQPAATVAAAAIAARGGTGLSSDVVATVRSMLSGLADDQIEELQACFPSSEEAFAPLWIAEEDAVLEQLPEAFQHLTPAMVSV